MSKGAGKYTNAHASPGVDQAIAAALERMAAAEAGGLKEWNTALARLRQEIILEVATKGALNQATAGAVKAGIGKVTAQYDQKFKDLLTENQRRLFTRGIQVVDKAVEAGKAELAVPYLDESVLQKAREFGAELVTGLTDYARGQVVKQIDLAVLGQKNLEDTIRGLTGGLGSPGVFGSLEKRAEVVYRTEVNRIANFATEMRIDQVASQVPDLRKRWLHSHVGIPRPGHLMLDGTVVKPDEKFKLRGRNGTVYEVDGPHDPVLPVEEVAGCKCQIVPVMAAQAKDKALKAEGQAEVAKKALKEQPAPPVVQKKPEVDPVTAKALAAADKLTVGMPGQVDVPLPIVKIPEQVNAYFKKLGLSAGKLWDQAALEPVQIKDLAAWQEAVDLKKLKAFIREPNLVKPGAKNAAGGSIEHPLVVVYQDKQWIWDGNHRIVAQKLRGETVAMVKKLDVTAAIDYAGMNPAQIKGLKALHEIPKIENGLKMPTGLQSAKLDSDQVDQLMGKVSPLVKPGLPGWTEGALDTASISTIVPTANVSLVEDTIKGKTNWGSQPMVVKHQGKWVAITGQEQLAAAKLQGMVPFVKMLDLDAATAPKPAAPAKKVKAPEPAKAPEQTHKVIDVSEAGWKKVGPQAGSNPGGLYESPDGQRWYVKQAPSEDYARNEILTAKLYQAAGVRVPEITEARINGQVGVASKIAPKKSYKNGEDLSKVQGVKQGFAVDAWLANWDVVGLEYDNLVESSGLEALRLDTGGGLRYRAQGKLKTDSQWTGDKVVELESMRYKVGAAHNDAAWSVFGNMTVDEMIGSIEQLKMVPDAAIHNLVQRYGPAEAGAKTALEKILIKRRDIILEAGKKWEHAKASTPNAGVQVAQGPGYHKWPDQDAFEQTKEMKKLLQAKIEAQARAALNAPKEMALPKDWSKQHAAMEKKYQAEIAKSPVKANAEIHRRVGHRAAKGVGAYDGTGVAIMEWYTGNGFDRFNKDLREFTLDYKTRLIETKFNQEMRKDPGYNGQIIYRKEPMAWYNANLKAGDTLTYHGFTSCSTDKNVWSGDCRITIQTLEKNSRAHDMRHISGHTSEKEILFESRAKFIVISSQDRNGLRYLFLKEIP